MRAARLDDVLHLHYTSGQGVHRKSVTESACQKGARRRWGQRGFGLRWCKGGFLAIGMSGGMCLALVGTTTQARAPAAPRRSRRGAHGRVRAADTATEDACVEFEDPEALAKQAMELETLFYQMNEEELVMREEEQLSPEQHMEEEERTVKMAEERSRRLARARGRGGPSKRKKRKGQQGDSSQAPGFYPGMTQYMSEVGKTNLLEYQDEVRLCEEIQTLKELERLHDKLEKEFGRVPTEGEWASGAGYGNIAHFRKRLEACREAKNRMIGANLRLVVSMARRYTQSNLVLSDLVQEGTMGLIKAAEKFDASRGYKFSTYAHWWIKQRLRASREYTNTIRMPQHVMNSLAKVSRAEREFHDEQGRDPSDEEVASKAKVSVNRMHTIKRAGKSRASLDSSLPSKDGGNQSTLGEVTADRSLPEPSSDADHQMRRSCVRDLLNTLDDKERHVLSLRYGLEDGQQQTLESIGTRFKVTRERIRQIERRALRKLRAPSRSRIIAQHAPEMLAGEQVEGGAPP